MDVGRRGDEDADDIVVREVVAREELVEQRVHTLPKMIGIVEVECGRAAQGSNCGGHGGAG
jgi:hypothetical protein